MKDHILDGIMSGIEGVLSLSRSKMTQADQSSVRQILKAGKAVKITLPGPETDHRFCRIELASNATQDPVWFMYDNQEQPDPVHRVMRPLKTIRKSRPR